MSKSSSTGLISRYWWIPLVTGLIAIGFGIWCLCDPSQSLPVLSYLFAAGMVLAGVMNCSFAFVNTSLYSGWGWSLFLGILELIAGIWMFFIPVPEMTVMFMYIVAIWILVVAIQSFVECCMLMKYSVWYVLGMILMLFCSIVFSFILLVNPIESIYISWLWIGLSLIMYGCYRVAFSFSMRNLGKFTGGLL